MSLKEKSITKSGTMLGSGVVIGLCIAKVVNWFTTSSGGQINKTKANANARLHFMSSKEADSKEGKRKIDQEPTFALHQPTLITQWSDPSWKPPQNQPSPYGNDFIDVDPQDSGVYSLLLSGVNPRPIAFVSSINKSGQINLAPYSYFNAVSHSPPMVMISICRNGKDGSKKDTWRNIEETGEFVVNMISEWFLESANYTSGNFPYGEDEFQKVGLTKKKSTKVKPPRVLESAFQMECKLRSTEDIYKNECPSDEESKSGPVAVTVVYGQVVMIHINKNVWDEKTKTVDFLKYKPVGRLGGVAFGHTTKLTIMARPSFTKRS